MMSKGAKYTHEGGSMAEATPGQKIRRPLFWLSKRSTDPVEVEDEEGPAEAGPSAES
jgi:hypothetical protein